VNAPADPPALAGMASDPPTALGAAPIRGLLRREPEDFRVDERLGFAADGAGTHLLLRVEKRAANTGWVAAQLARLAAVPPREIGWCGHKDRHAVTTQWFSVPWPLRRPAEESLAFVGEGFAVLESARHGRKLRPGSHRGNGFEIRVHEIEGDSEALAARLAALAERGVPNYFGPQRFGRQGANLARALRWADGGQPPAGRAERGFALSAARAVLFNRVLADRIEHGSWDRLLPGEVVMLDGTQSFFKAPEIDAALHERAARGDVHPSGPLCGRGLTPATGEAFAREEQALRAGEPLVELLVAAGLAHERRALRLRPGSLEWAVDGRTLCLRFDLPRGAFATAVLHELVAGGWIGDGSGEE
jgi:tRNA pseudouridine13 synthase